MALIRRVGQPQAPENFIESLSSMLLDLHPPLSAQEACKFLEAEQHAEEAAEQPAAQRQRVGAAESDEAVARKLDEQLNPKRGNSSGR